MSKEVLTSSERYVRKTNRIILIVGITSFVVFLFGLLLLFSSGSEQQEQQEFVFTEDEDALGMTETNDLMSETIEFEDVDDTELPITTTPNPIDMGQVVLGTEAKNVLTIGTNGRKSIRVVSVKLAEPPFDGFTYQDSCTSAELRGNQTCNITMKWAPVVSGNVQNNFIVSWHETNVSAANAKAQKIPVEGKAVEKEDCNYCDTASGGITGSLGTKVVRDANGNIIGRVLEDGTVVDENGNVIGKVSEDGRVIDESGSVIGTVSADTSKMRVAYDPDGNVLGYVDDDGYVRDENGNVIGRVNSD